MLTTLLIPLADENPLFPQPVEIILAVVFVLLLTFVMWKMVIPRFEATYAERTEAIQGGIEKAEKAQEAAEAALRSRDDQVDGLCSLHRMGVDAPNTNTRKLPLYRPLHLAARPSRLLRDSSRFPHLKQLHHRPALLYTNRPSTGPLFDARSRSAHESWWRHHAS